MTNNTIPHDHHHRLRPHHEEMDQLQAALAVKPQVKRQVRRRTHTSRPYQERLLNMAEARREIVTALKIHRASSRTTRQQQHQQSTYLHREEPPPLQLQLQQQQEEQKQVQVAGPFLDRSQPAVIDEEASLAAAHTTMSNTAAAFANNPLCNSPPAQHWIAAGSYYCSSPPPILCLPCDLTPPELPPTAAMGGLVELEQEHCQGGLERLVRSLPVQPLGLNLSFQGFGVSVDDGAKDDCEDLLGLPLTQPSPDASYSYSPPAVETASIHAYGHGSPALSATDAENHSVIDAPAALDGGEMMAQASTGGEMQGVECSEAADVAAWWSKIFESVESGQRASPDVAAAPGLPAEWQWLCVDDAGLVEQAGPVTGGKPSPDVLGTMMQHVDDGDGADGDYSCGCYEGGRSDDGEDVTLPCIGDDTQGWEGEWFSSS